MKNRVPRVQPWVLAFHSQRSFGCHSIQNLKHRVQWQDEGQKLSTHEVVITMRTVFVALIELCDIFPEGFFALLADECHLRRLRKLMRLRFCVAFGTIEPLLAAGRADRNLGIQDVLTIAFQCRLVEREITGWRTTCCRCGIDLKKERGSHAYNAWHFTLKISPKQNTKLLWRMDFLQRRRKVGVVMQLRT